MTSKPMLFSAPMVRALLEGRKTQTRRILANVQGIGSVTEFQPSDTKGYDWIMRDRRMCWNDFSTPDLIARAPHPAGSEIWVRESGWERPDRTKRDLREGADTWPPYEYTADLLEAEMEDLKAWGWKRRNSIHMPHWASRIRLKVTDVRVQRLQDISEEDALAEGVTPLARKDTHTGEMHPLICLTDPRPLKGWGPRQSYASLWESINGPGSWDANPWVWAYAFTGPRTS